MDIRRYRSIVFKWLPLVLLFFILGSVAGYAATRRTPGIFESTATVLVAPGGNLAATSYGDVSATDRLSQNYASWLTARPLLETVIAQLKLRQTADALAKQITVKAVRDTSMLNIVVDSTDPQQAAEIANRLPVIFADNYRQVQETKYLGEAADLNTLLTQVQGQIDQAQARLQSLRTASPAAPQNEIDSLAAFLAQEQTTYADLVKRTQDLQLAQADAKASLVMVEPAVPSARPVKPSKTMNVLMGAVIGFMLAAVTAFLAEFLDGPIQNSESAQSALGLPTLGLIWRWPGRRKVRRPVVLSQPYSAATDAFQKLTDNLQLAAQARPIRSILVTSASPDEGKSVVAANLAVSLAQAGRRVMLVDCNFLRPSLHQMFGAPNQAGVATALLDSGNLDGLTQETPIPNLCLITAGAEAPYASGMLGSERMHGILGSLTGQADVVILDGPAVRSSRDAESVAARVDVVLLVIAAGRTRHSAAVKALNRLTDTDGDILGVVLNDVPRHGGTSEAAALLPREDQTLTVPGVGPALMPVLSTQQMEPQPRRRGRS